MREIKFRAWYNYPCSDLKPKTPYGTGSDWLPRWQMGKVQTYYQSKNKVRVSGFQRYYGVDGSYKESKDSCDMQIGENCILMQYTGLKDKNGKEIYEGDIIAKSVPLFQPLSRGQRIDEVVWGRDDKNTGMWEARLISDDRIKRNPENKVPYFEPFGLGCEPQNFEVIGNVWENPELLKND